MLLTAKESFIIAVHGGSVCVCVGVHAETDTIRSVFMACYTAAVTGSRAFDTFLHSSVHLCWLGIQTAALAPTPSNVVLFGGQKDNLALTASATDWL